MMEWIHTWLLGLWWGGTTSWQKNVSERNHVPHAWEANERKKEGRGPHCSLKGTHLVTWRPPTRSHLLKALSPPNSTKPGIKALTCGSLRNIQAATFVP